MDYKQPYIAPFATSAVRLLRGPVFEDQSQLWNEINQYQTELTKYFSKIAIELIINKKDGYAFLKQIELDDNKRTIGLIKRIPLTYELTIVCVLLREWLMEFEANDLETAYLYISPKEFRNRMELFFKERSNEMKFIYELKRYMKECEKMGFLKLVHKNPTHTDDDRYEVRRIIKARVTIEELTRFKELLEDELKSM